ncbi:MAG: 5-dehydro-4-deoxy-D-glucuronate isomerase [Spirochaetales bacterium]|nr:5-dehydro-4-deoxy-D-glucuronate isomerase [Spirochaetales bacterium]
MEIRNAVDPEHAKTMDSDELRDRFLVTDLFSKDKMKLVYSYFDRLIIGGACPVKPLGFSVDKKVIGSEYFLERRELGIINIGGNGSVTVDGKEYALRTRDGLYIGMGSKGISFQSESAGAPARFYLNSAPAHKTYPTTMVSIKDAAPVHLGSNEESNKRTIYKYFHPDGVKSCQLVMGMTLLDPNNVWNTMPTHTHVRRMEAYFYFDMSADTLVFHLMGEPAQTRHIVLRNEEAVISPSWSIHSGVGTRNYSFIWGMAGENQLFTDMDDVPLSELR